MFDKQYSGSCLCSQVKFKVEGEFDSFLLCHCKYCQKDTGSAHAANLFSSRALLTWIEGEEIVRIFNLPTTRHIKAFCTVCGSALPSIQMDGKIVVVPAGSLDSASLSKPDAHIFYESKAGWEDSLEKIKRFEGVPQ